MLKRFFLLLFPLFFASQSCANKTRHGAHDNPQAVETGSITPSPTPLVDENYFRIFKPEVNFLKYYNVSNPKYVRDRFKVLPKESSQIAVLNIDQGLSERMSLLDQAKISVRVQALTFWADETGWLVANKLIALKKKGLDVKVIIDSISNLGLPTQKMFFELQQNGIQVMGYEPAYLFALEEWSPTDTWFSRLTKLNLRFHEKYFIIDGESLEEAQAIIGGSNISNAYYRVDTKTPMNNWTDQDVVVRGLAAIEAASFFDENFQLFQDHKQLRSYIDLDNLWNAAQRIAHGKGQDEILKLGAPKLDADIKASVDKKSVVDVSLEWNDGPMRLLRNRPRTSEFIIGDAFVSMVEDAKKEILIMNSFFIPDKLTITALTDALKRGVKIKVLTNSLDSTLFPPLVYASRSRYAQIFAPKPEGLEIYEWQGDKILHNGEGQLHAKYAVFDDLATMVGSFNLDPRSMSYNSENVVVTLNANTAQKLKDLFASQIDGKFSKSISYDQAKTFDQSDKSVNQIQSKFAYLISPFL